jgi:hypothetical protein
MKTCEQEAVKYHEVYHCGVPEIYALCEDLWLAKRKNT